MYLHYHLIAFSLVSSVLATTKHRHAARATTTTSTAPSAPTQPGTTANCNKFHTVVSGDDCGVLELKYGINHTQFITWNPAVSQDCQDNFWPKYAYCVGIAIPTGPTQPGTVSNCNKYHTVVKGDDCGTLESKYGITHTQFITWNPAVSQNCLDNFWLGNSYCVGVGAGTETSSTVTSTRISSSTKISTSRPITTANATYSIANPVVEWNITSTTVDKLWPPTQTQAGQPSYCNKWHLVKSGESCETVVTLYDTTLDMVDLLAWNPTLGQDCSGLFYNWWVCVGIQEQSSLTLVYPTDGTAPVSIPEPTEFTPIPSPTINSSFVPAPTQAGLSSDCQGFYKAVADDTCPKLLVQFEYLTLDNFLAWNPALDSSCAIWVDYYYCIANPSSPSSLPFPPTVTARASPVQNGIISTCVSWYMMTVSDTCSSISLMFGTFSTADFKSWNPAVDVGGDCADIREGYWYCVATPETPKTRTAEVPTTSFPADDGPTATGTTTRSTFSPTSSTSMKTTTTTTPTAVATPVPTQSGMISGCVGFYYVNAGEGCWDIANTNGISLDNFYAWNKAAAPDCSGLWSNVYVCIRISGSATTIAPKPTSKV
ncbi:hypothetical protein VTL71DRAFT_14834 [Oculimacula yallundae]|uniref:LysM domain-containing protein n=1 Tax=Oculimacula yallundae TaxID=86028 RepID=A0ABR4CEV9_9HELO